MTEELAAGVRLNHDGYAPVIHIPPEIWEYVFETYASSWEQLDPVRPESLSSIRLACRIFAEIARPVAFRHFIFKPFVCQESSDTPHLFLPKGINVPKSSERLHGWASPANALHVRHITIEPANWDGPYTKEGDGEHLLDAFFRVLPRFTNTSRVNCAGFPFDDFRLSQLCTLSHLQFLTVQKCVVAANVAHRQSGLSTFEYNTSYTGHFDEEHHRKTTNWLSVTQSDHIRDIRLSLYHPTAATQFLISLAATHTTQYLTVLEVPCSHGLVAQLISTLSAAPSSSLARLSLLNRPAFHTFPIPPDIPSTLVPALREYTGPPQYLANSNLVPSQDSLRLLRLCSSSEPFGEPDFMLRTLLHLSDSLASLVLLRLDVNYLPRDLLVTIFERCTGLQDLYIGASPGDIGARRRRDLRRTTHDEIVSYLFVAELPAYLNKLAFSFMYYPSEQHSTAEWSSLKHHLFRAHPGLKDCHVKFNDLNRHWCREGTGLSNIHEQDADSCGCHAGQGMQFYTIPES